MNIFDKEKFRSNIKMLDRVVISINTKYMLSKGLCKKLSPTGEYYDVFNMSPAFWNAVVHNIESEVVMMLAKVYDDDKFAFSVNEVIRIAKAHHEHFPEIDNEIARRSDNDKLYVYNSITKLKKTIEGIILKLKTLRDKHKAHFDKKQFTNLKELYDEYGISYIEIEKLIDVARIIVDVFLSNSQNLDRPCLDLDYSDYEVMFEFARKGYLKTKDLG